MVRVFKSQISGESTVRSSATTLPCALVLLCLGCKSGTVSEADGGSGPGSDASGGKNASTADATPGENSQTDGAAEDANTAATGGDGSVDGGPVPHVNDCSGLGAAGVFEDITPPEVKAGMSTAQDGGGTFALAVDPVNQGTLYVGTLHQKVWKSTDCGATWTHISTGRNGDRVDSGMNWTFAVDPQDPNVVYTNSGYGSNGLFKSSNGGIDWDEIWPPAGQPELAKAFTYNFANVIALDPKDHEHVLLTFHEACLPPHAATCIAESMDGGSSWTLIDGEPEWNGNEGQVIFFLNDSRTWLWGSQNNGFFRSDDGGDSWEAIPGMTTSHLQGSQLVRTQKGEFFAAGADGIWHSPDGKASSWSLVPDTGPIAGGLVSDGTSLFTSTCYFNDFCNPRYLRSPADDGAIWTQLPSPTLSMGGTMAYDPGHKLLYSSNLQAGLWRVVVE